jgi:hypothetical protein
MKKSTNCKVTDCQPLSPNTDKQQTSSDGCSYEHGACDEKGEEDEGGSAVPSSMISSQGALVALSLMCLCHKLKFWE